MDMLTNAIESIILGVEDYQVGTRPRLISAVRNIHAGILLLYKEALRRHSPDDSNEVLVKAKILPQKPEGGIIEFIGVGKKTVNVREINNRFKKLRITTDWPRFEKINQVRNEIEHYYSKVSKRSLQGPVANTFVIVRNFVVNELGDDPHNLLGETTWQEMLAIEEIYNEERKKCIKSIATVDWLSGAVEEGITKINCRDCGSDLLCPVDETKSYYDIILRCRECGEDETSNTFLPRAVQMSLAYEMYSVYHDGNDLPYTNCPECGAEAYVLEEERCG